MSQGFARNGWPRSSEVIQSANFVASATPHTKGSWVEIDASAQEDVVGMWISSDVAIGLAGADTSMLLDIGIGAAASEVAVVSNIPVGGHNLRLPVFLPIYIPAGSRIAGRIQALITVDVFDPIIVLLFGGRMGSWGGFSIAETIGVDTATSGPTTGDLTDNAWDEAVASTANTYRALTLHVCLPPGVIAVTTGTYTIEVGTGGAGSERTLGAYFVNTTSAELVFAIQGPDFLEQTVDAGSRLAIRKNTTVDCSAALIGWR